MFFVLDHTLRFGSSTPLSLVFLLVIDLYQSCSPSNSQSFEQLVQEELIPRSDYLYSCSNSNLGFKVVLKLLI
jgi:hypothetical protein